VRWFSLSLPAPKVKLSGAKLCRKKEGLQAGFPGGASVVLRESEAMM
jgi:hypothetical protein